MAHGLLLEDRHSKVNRSVITDISKEDSIRHCLYDSDRFNFFYTFISLFLVSNIYSFSPFSPYISVFIFPASFALPVPELVWIWK